jgi:hypothetical protein
MRSFSVTHLRNSAVNKRAMLGRGYVMFDMLTGSAFWIVANHIQQNCFRAADSYWDNQETPHILWNLEGSVLCLRELTTLQNQMNPVLSHPLCFFNIHFDVIFQIVPGSFIWFLSVRFLHQTPVCFLLHLCMCHMPCPYHHILFAHPDISKCWGVWVM